MGDIVLGLDIGGANLKAALQHGTACSQRFALWRHPERLTSELRSFVAGLCFDRIAVTMSGELCRCFETKRDGVRRILRSVAELAGPKPVTVWGLDGSFHDLNELADLSNFAASNWLALATYAGRFAPIGPSVLIDVGSTTADVVAIQEGRPAPTGRTDAERLKTGELIYCGVRRTPVCAIMGFDVMAEVFATMLDVYLVLGRIAEDSSNIDTADRRPATQYYAHGRLARMLGGDRDSVSVDAARRLAEQAHDRQLSRIRDSVTRYGAGAKRIVSGAGEFLAAEASGRANEVISLVAQLGSEVASAACAYAVAVLAAERS